MAGSIGTRLVVAAAVLLLAGAGVSSSAAGEATTTGSTTTQSTTTEASLRTLTVDVNGEGRVALSPSGAVCPPDCSVTFDEETAVTLTATAAEGFEFDGWSGDCVEDGPSCSLTLSGDAGVEAAFTQETTTGSEPPPPSPPQPGAAPPPGPPPSPLEEVDRMLKRLPAGCVVFNVPEEVLTVGASGVVQLLLSAQRPLCRREQRRLKRRITALGEKVGSPIKVADVMEAHLTGSKFKILTVTDERQAVSAQDVTEWKWEIEPTEAGTHRLFLRLSAIIHVGDGSEPRTIRTFDRTLEVRVTFLSQLSSFFEDNWQWLWGAILIPVVGWLASRRRKRAEPATG
jgi:Divergent InlB B-repeat domain